MKKKKKKITHIKGNRDFVGVWATWEKWLESASKMPNVGCL